MSDCPFCLIVEGKVPATVVGSTEGAVAFLPLNPVTEGHVLVVPDKHARYVWELDRNELADTIDLVAELARDKACNVIQSNGVAATQTVPHVHFHIVPRSRGDGLALPWTGQTERPAGEAPAGPSD